VADGRSRGNLIDERRWLGLPPFSSRQRAGVDSLARSFLLSLEAKTELKGRSFVTSIANLKAASPLALDDDLIWGRQMDARLATW